MKTIQSICKIPSLSLLSLNGVDLDKSKILGIVHALQYASLQDKQEQLNQKQQQQEVCDSKYAVKIEPEFYYVQGKEEEKEEESQPIQDEEERRNKKLQIPY